eukprot:9480818-Pyramimonas_sp.AAC.1
MSDQDDARQFQDTSRRSQNGPKVLMRGPRRSRDGHKTRPHVRSGLERSQNSTSTLLRYYSRPIS